MADATQRAEVRLGEFERAWVAQIAQHARVHLSHALRPQVAGLPTRVADAYVQSLGLAGIGYNWELLDPGTDPNAPRAALAELAQAVGHAIDNPSREALGAAQGMRCAEQLLAAFDRSALTVLSNRYDGLWHPISGAPVEWGFLVYDEETIALLLLAKD